MAVSVNIKGFKEVEKALKEFGKEGQAAALDVVFATASDIERDAKSLAPVDLGKLQQSITKTKVTDQVKYKVQANEPYAAFVEFGTGALVSIPDGWTDMAADFRGRGIRQVNIAPQPYLYPAFQKGSRMLFKDLRNELKRLTDKFNG